MEICSVISICILLNLYILLLTEKFNFIILKMAKVCGQNINVNFNYCRKAVILFMSRIVVNKLSAVHKILFRKLENDLKCFIKLDADIQFLKYLFWK